MTARFSKRVVASAALWLLLVAAPAFGAELRGRVVGIADGDTITILDADRQQHRIRLNGIDAPETGQAFSQVAKSNLSTLVFGQDVLVVWVKADRYGRLVGTVTRGSVNLNLEQIKSGLAWYYREYASDVAAENRPLAAETEAREAKRGLWRDTRPIAPWTYRGDARTPVSAATPKATPPPPTKPLGLLGTISSAIEVCGNRASEIFHVPGCRNYDDIAMRNRVIFRTEAEAVAAGYRKAGNCR